jgi:hypothetical protein
MRVLKFVGAILLCLISLALWPTIVFFVIQLIAPVWLTIVVTAIVTILAFVGTFQVLGELVVDTDGGGIPWSGIWLSFISPVAGAIALIEGFL